MPALAIEPGRHIVMVSDVTEDRERERGLQVKAEGALDSLEAGVYVVSMAGEISLWNQAAEEITGYPAEQAIGAPGRSRSGWHPRARSTRSAAGCSQRCRDPSPRGGDERRVPIEVVRRSGAAPTARSTRAVPRLTCSATTTTCPSACS